MGSEDQVLELMALLDTGLQQANRIEEKLTEYERKLQVYDIPELEMSIVLIAQTQLEKTLF